MDAYGQWEPVQDLNPGDFAFITKWGFTPGLKDKLVYIVSAGPGRQRDFWVIGDARPDTISFSADFLSPVTVPLYRLSLLEQVAAEVWLAENDIAKVRAD